MMSSGSTYQGGNVANNTGGAFQSDGTPTYGSVGIPQQPSTVGPTGGFNGGVLTQPGEGNKPAGN